MFEETTFYESAEKGERPLFSEFKNYVGQFRHLIIWGAGNLGTALGKVLQERSIAISVYWDQDYKNKPVCNGVNVIEPFTGDYKPEDTLVIIGIVNGTLSHTWQKGVLLRHGYEHSLLGMYIYEAIGCGQEIGKPLDIKECVGTNICNFNTCKRYMNIVKNGREKTGLSVQVLEIIVSSRCTLDCKYCGQQAGETKRKFPKKYRDYPLEEIKESIDAVMDILDVVGTFSIIGGEAFIHPDIGEIIRHCLTKDNVAIIAITTNGVCKISDELLEMIKDDRVKINFSNYTENLPKNEKNLFWSNVEKIKQHGFACNVATPIWTISTDELRENPDFSEKTVIARKNKCVFGPSIAGKYLYACPQTERQHRMEVRNVEQDIIDLSGNRAKLADKIRDLLGRKHYEACKYLCTNMKPTKQIPPGEQYRAWSEQI